MISSSKHESVSCRSATKWSSSAVYRLVKLLCSASKSKSTF